MPRATWPRATCYVPNAWFVGVTPRRNPELVVAVLWQNGEFSYYPARIASKVVSAYVEKQRRLAHNLAPVKAAEAPVEVGAVWSVPDPEPGKDGSEPARIQAGHFFVHPGGQVVAQRAGSWPGMTQRPRARLKPASQFRCSRRRTRSRAHRNWARPCRAALEETMSPGRRFLSFRDFDWTLLAMVLLLCAISVLEIYSATLHTKYAGFHTKQMFWIAGGLVAMFLLRQDRLPPPARLGLPGPMASVCAVAGRRC